VTLQREPVPAEALAGLRRRLAVLPPRHRERRALMASTCSLYAISRATLYRLLREGRRPRDAHRSDRGRPRLMPAAEIERWCEIVAALKARTTNKKGRCLSTARVLELLAEHGVETPAGLEQLPKGRITASTLNRHMRRLGYDHARMMRQPAAVRFEAERSNDLWHFDLSPSDLKQLPAPSWVDTEGGSAPTLMLFSVVDDRSGLAYLEYHCVHGEDVEAAPLGQRLRRTGHQVLVAPQAQLPRAQPQLGHDLGQALAALKQPLDRLGLELGRKSSPGPLLRHPVLLG
jgi:hypothetical protein